MSEQLIPYYFLEEVTPAEPFLIVKVVEPPSTLGSIVITPKQREAGIADMGYEVIKIGKWVNNGEEGSLEIIELGDRVLLSPSMRPIIKFKDVEARCFIISRDEVMCIVRPNKVTIETE